MKKTPSIPVILGETASGKTSVGIELAKEIGGEIISVDSRKVYRGLKIGTATPDGERQGDAYVVKGVPHYLMGHRPPDHLYTAGDFAREAGDLIEKILRRGRRPILVGGTGFYFKALKEGLPKLPPRDEGLRAELADRLKTEGLTALHEELRSIDPEAAACISARDPQKTLRALEIFQLTGRPFSQWKNSPRQASRFSFAILGLQWPRRILEKRIEERSARMEKNGMIEEAEQVLKAGHSQHCAALSSFGYREAVRVLEGEIPRSEFLPRLIRGTKAYAKRQRTWFRTQTKPLWFECNPAVAAKDIALKMKDFIDKMPS